MIFRFSVVISGLISLVLSLPAFAASSIPNFHQVAPEIYRGARPHAEGLSELARMGVQTIINLQGGDAEVLWFTPLIRVMQPGELPKAIANERNMARSLGMKFLNFPTNSFLTVNEERSAGIQQALMALADPANHPVFIHCEFGKDRTGLLIALYRVLHQGWTPEAAHDEMVERGHWGVNGFFTRALDTYFYEQMEMKKPTPLAVGF
jgi:tyrosine-protein phosphatase SIW14